MLLGAGASTLLRNKFGRLAHEEAQERGNWEVGALIETQYLKDCPEEVKKEEEEDLAEEQMENVEEEQDEEEEEKEGKDLGKELKEELGLPENADAQVKFNP